MLETLLAILATATFGTIGWVVTISSRITKVETKQEDLPTLINSQFAVVTNQFAAIDHRLARIEKAMNGSLSGKH